MGTVSLKMMADPVQHHPGFREFDSLSQGKLMDLTPKGGGTLIQDERIIQEVTTTPGDPGGSKKIDQPVPIQIRIAHDTFKPVGVCGHVKGGIQDEAIEIGSVHRGPIPSSIHGPLQSH